MNHFFQRQIHPIVTIDKMAVQRLAILQLHQHRVALCGRQKTQRQLNWLSLASLLFRNSFNMRPSARRETDIPFLRTARRIGRFVEAAQ